MAFAPHSKLRLDITDSEWPSVASLSKMVFNPPKHALSHSFALLFHSTTIRNDLMYVSYFCLSPYLGDKYGGNDQQGRKNIFCPAHCWILGTWNNTWNIVGAQNNNCWMNGLTGMQKTLQAKLSPTSSQNDFLEQGVCISVLPVNLIILGAFIPLLF